MRCKLLQHLHNNDSVIFKCIATKFYAFFEILQRVRIVNLCEKDMVGMGISIVLRKKSCDIKFVFIFPA